MIGDSRAAWVWRVHIRAHIRALGGSVQAKRGDGQAFIGVRFQSMRQSSVKLELLVVGGAGKRQTVFTFNLREYNKNPVLGIDLKSTSLHNQNAIEPAQIAGRGSNTARKNTKPKR